MRASRQYSTFVAGLTMKPRAGHPRSSRPHREHEGFHRVDSLVRRIAHVVFAAVLLLALLGLFGDGPLAHARESREGFTLEYDRFVRTFGDIRITLARRERTEVEIEELIHSGEHIDSSSPTPALVGRVVRVQAEAGEGSVALRWKADEPGLRRGWIRAGSERVRVWILVYP